VVNHASFFKRIAGVGGNSPPKVGKPKGGESQGKECLLSLPNSSRRSQPFLQAYDLSSSESEAFKSQQNTEK
jgi:hypothetical protein